jgi:hypothetical protein
MPNKYVVKKGWSIPKQHYKVSNWHDYNTALRNRGDIEVWLSDEAIEQWYEKNRVYDGTGSLKKFSDFAIITYHEIRQVFRLPLRKCHGFINSLFRLKNISLACPDYSCLSKRLLSLEIKSSRYKINQPNENVAAIAIDSTGLKLFGRDEWHQEKHKVSANRSWRKLHIAVDNKHIIHGAALTDRFVSDSKAVVKLLDQIDFDASQFTLDDANLVYENISAKFPEAAIVIPPSSKAKYNVEFHDQRNNNLQKIKTFGRMAWQKAMEYGRRNYDELCIRRYKKYLVINY